MKKLSRYLKLYLSFISFAIKEAMAYRSDFIIWSLVTISWVVFTFIFYELFFRNISSIGGWSKGQVYVLQGFYFLMDFIFWGILYANFNDFSKRISMGAIDMELTKPINTQFLLSFKSLNLNQVNNLIIGMATIGYGLKLANIQPSFLDILYTIIIFSIATVFLYSGYFITMCFAFFTERLENIVYLFPQIRQFTKIPAPAYQGFLKVFFTYAIPITLIASLPSEFLFGQRNWFFVGVLTIFSFVTLKISNLILHEGIKRYSSASS